MTTDLYKVVYLFMQMYDCVVWPIYVGFALRIQCSDTQKRQLADCVRIGTSSNTCKAGDKYVKSMIEFVFPEE